LLGLVVGIPAGQVTSLGAVPKTRPVVAQGPVRVDVNRAELEELQRLPGMTTRVADRIIRNRPYRKLDELISRKVIGTKQFAEILEYIVVRSDGM